MSKTCNYAAPWGTTVKIVTVLVIALCLGLTALLSAQGLGVLRRGDGGPVWVIFACAVLPLVTLLASLFTLVRGYRLEDKTLVVLRLGRVNRIPLEGLASATFDPRACKGSLRLAGTGGVFSFTGWFSNAALGSYQAFATDFSRTVVLKLLGRTVVVTPDRPKDFVAEVLTRV